MRSGAGVSVVTTKVYQSPEVTYDAADLDTIGVELFTIPANTIILRMWLELSTPFTNDTAISQDQWAVMTDGDDATEFGLSYGLADDYPNISDTPIQTVGDRLKTQLGQDARFAEVVFPQGLDTAGLTTSTPWRVDQTCTFYHRMSFVDDVTYDLPTQGSLTWFALVAGVGE